jgi:2-octaprenyl-6-methoxyphenol hydroxylase
MQTDYDILIVGGGMVGGSLAVALGETGFSVGLVEAHPFGSGSEPAYDDRSIALAYGSRRIFEGIGLWQGMADELTPIQQIHVSDRGHLGVTRLDCKEEGVEALGYVVESRIIGRVLNERFSQVANLEVISPAKLEDISITKDAGRVELNCTGNLKTVSARLIVAADGTMSAIRDKLGIEVQRKDYGQSALIANVSTERPHEFVAYERFTDSGPLALLPMSHGRCSLVWTHNRDELARTEVMDDETFLNALQERFGYRLGRFTRVGQRASYPLGLLRAKEDSRPRVVLIGNASHTLHPVAGQGFNLGLRDVAVLADLLFDADQEGIDPGSLELLEQYTNWRKGDLDRVSEYTDILVRLFTNPWPPLAHARSGGLMAVNAISPLKRLLARQNMGRTGHMPRLARGLPLQAYPKRNVQ